MFCDDAQSRYLDLYENGDWLGLIPTDPNGNFVLGRGGAKFDPNKPYSAELVLNTGSASEIKSGPVSLPVGQIQILSDDGTDTPMLGAVTDDVTTLKLRLTVKNGWQTLTNLNWKIADPQVPDASDAIKGTLLDGNNPVDTLPVSFNSNGVATATYEVPETFVRFGTTQEANDRGLAERQVQITLNGQEVKSPAIRLKRPPVVLVHGLWGCGNKAGCGNNLYAWKDFEPKLNDKQQYDITSVDYYEQGIVRGIADLVVETDFKAAIYEAARSSNAKGYASSKVDVIGHSMGGLVTRQYCADNSTDCQDRIRRVVTIATPHFGSELADLLLVFRDDQNHFPNISKCRNRVNAFVYGGDITVFIFSQAVEPHPINGGAIDDLATGNLPEFIASTTTPGRWNQLPSFSQSLSAHSIVGLFAAELGDGKSEEISGLWKYVLKSCGFTLDNVFRDEFDLNDRIVRSSSQQESLSAQFATPIPSEDHLSVRNAQATIDRIKLLLDSQSSDGLFSQ